MQILYVPHPLTREAKARIRAENAPCKIVDARFAPAGVPIYGVQKEEKAEAVSAAGNVPTKTQIAGMKKADAIEWLEAHGVDSPQGGIAELRAHLRSVMYVD
jgi:hypothetical protein